MMVSTRLLSINSSYVHSQLEFTLFENVTLVNVWCNLVMITITNRGKSALFYFRSRCYIVTRCINLVSVHYFLPLGI